MDKKILGCLLSMFVTHIIVVPDVWAQLCDEPSSVETVRIYYANGMRTKKPKAETTKVRISSILGSHNRSYGTAYNHDETDHEELLEAAKQRSIDSHQFWQWYHNLPSAPAWFREDYATYLNNLLNVSADPDLQDHVTQYLRDLRSGKKVLIVAHSQGNLYANLGYKHIRLNYPEYKDSIGIVGIATPTHLIEGGTASKTNYYATHPHDKVINLVRLLYPSTLPANIDSVITGVDNRFCMA